MNIKPIKTDSDYTNSLILDGQIQNNNKTINIKSQNKDLLLIRSPENPEWFYY